METRADGAGTDDTRVQTAIRCPTERGPRNEEDLELFQERTLKVSLMLRYAGRAADAPLSNSALYKQFDFLIMIVYITI